MIKEGRTDKAYESHMRVILMKRFLTKFPHRREKVERPILDRSPGLPGYDFPGNQRNCIKQWIKRLI